MSSANILPDGSARKKSTRRVLMTLVACLAVFVADCSGGQIKTDEESIDSGKATVDFSLRDLKGNLFRLADLRGKVIYLSFWATWCEPCRIELSILQKFWKKRRNSGFELVTISADPPDLENDVRQQVRRYAYKFPVLLDQETEVSDRYNPTMALPFGLLIDRQGKIVAVHQGFRIGDEETVKKEIMELLAK